MRNDFQSVAAVQGKLIQRDPTAETILRESFENILTMRIIERLWKPQNLDPVLAVLGGISGAFDGMAAVFGGPMPRMPGAPTRLFAKKTPEEDALLADDKRMTICIYMKDHNLTAADINLTEQEIESLKPVTPYYQGRIPAVG